MQMEGKNGGGLGRRLRETRYCVNGSKRQLYVVLLLVQVSKKVDITLGAVLYIRQWPNDWWIRV